MQSNSDRVELLTAGFPGLSIKGLISVGPEFSINGQLDASLKVSGELNAGKMKLLKRLILPLKTWRRMIPRLFHLILSSMLS